MMPIAQVPIVTIRWSLSPPVSVGTNFAEIAGARVSTGIPVVCPLSKDGFDLGTITSAFASSCHSANEAPGTKARGSVALVLGDERRAAAKEQRSLRSQTTFSLTEEDATASRNRQQCPSGVVRRPSSPPMDAAAIRVRAAGWAPDTGDPGDCGTLRRRRRQVVDQ